MRSSGAVSKRTIGSGSGGGYRLATKQRAFYPTTNLVVVRRQLARLTRAATTRRLDRRAPPVLAYHVPGYPQLSRDGPMLIPRRDNMRISMIPSSESIGPSSTSVGPSESKVGQNFCLSRVSFLCPVTP